MSPRPLQLRQQNTNVSFTESCAPERPTVLFQDRGSSLVPFRYSALKHPDSVRLLKLEPSATGAEVLSCSFLDVALSATPEYEVLSGFWGHEGSPFRPVSLLADGQSCKTTAELAQALFRFRRRDRARVMWIQSLCVNSDDTGERSKQIERLRHTLLSARRLIVWLGPAQDNSELVFEHARRFEHLRGKYEFIPSFPEDGFGFRREAPFGQGVATAPDHLQDYPADADAAFRKLCARAWFYRSWSIPELVLSKDIILVCGDHELGQQVSHINPLSWLCRLSPSRFQALPSRDVSFYDELDIPVLDAVGHVSTLRFDHRLPGRTISMGEAYRIVRNCRATDPRDSVFAIAALELVSPVEVDYGLSVSEVHQQATFALLPQHRSLQVLRRLASPSGRRNHELPSWTLDFSSPLETTSALWALPGPRGLLQDGRYFDEEAEAGRRGLWPSDSRVPRPRHERRTNALILTGLLMETIAAIGPAMHAAVAATAAAIAKAEAATTTHAGSEEEDDDVHVRFSQILHDWGTLAVSHLLRDDGPSSPSNSTTTTNNGGRRRFPQPVSDAFLDTLIAHDAHDVMRNNPPRPPVSSEADRGRRWYDACARRRCGIATAVLSAAEPEYFALRGGANGEKEYCLPAGPWWGLAWSSIAGDKAYRHNSAAGEGAFGRRVAGACADKRFFVTDKGSMGLAPAGAREGDVLAFFPTGQFPMVLRPCGGQNKAGHGGNDDDAGRYWSLVGEGFLYDWWRHLSPVFEHFNKRLGYTHLLTEFAIQ